MSGQVIVLNGASSSGKTTLARALQDILPGLWLHFGIDDLVAALPPRLLSGEGIAFGSDGRVEVGTAFRQAEAAWMSGIAATARAGVSVVVDDVFLGGAASQERWRQALSDLALGDLPCLWVGVQIDAAEAEKREQMRPDRAPGMHRQQAGVVHAGVHYDLQLDSTRQSPEALAERVRRTLLAL